MSQTTRSGQLPPTATNSGDRQNVQPTQMSGWVGWIAFASMMMMMLGSFHVIEGLVAVFKDEVFLVGESGLTVNIDYTAWGWTHILGGIIIVAAGAGALSGKVWARTVGVLMAMISALINIAFLPAYPIWSTIMIAVSILVIWALTVHGSEMRE